MDFNNILGQIQTKASTVAINISSKSIMEVMEIDKNGVINSYTCVPIQYNNLTKEIENIYDFQSSLKQAFSDLKLSLNSKVYVSIPTYVIEHENLPEVDDDESIKTMLTSSAEKNYIFKKYDPAISFFKIPSGHNNETINNLEICYTALRADEYSKIKGVFEELGLKVLAIDSSYSSLINGVIATNKVNPNLLNQNGKWNIINITSNSYTIFNMSGMYLTDVYEEPLAVKSFSEEEIYQVITNSLELTLGNYSANQIIIVSQSDNVSAEYLAGIIPANCSIAYIEDNKYRKQLIEMSFNITQSIKTKVTLEAVGISTWSRNTNGFKFNFLNAPIASESVAVESVTLTIDGQDVEITSEKIQRWSILIGLLLCILAAAAYITCTWQYNGKNHEKLAIVEDTNRLQKELNIQPQSTGISEVEFLQKNYGLNMNYKKSYAAISREIPDMLWIEEFQMLEDSKMYLRGRSYRMEDVLNYYDSLSKLGKFPNLKISTLRVSNNKISDLLLQPNSTITEETTYEFAFGETVYIDPQPVTPATTTDGTTPPPAPANATDIPPAPTNLPATN